VLENLFDEYRRQNEVKQDHSKNNVSSLVPSSVGVVNTYSATQPYK